MVKGIFLKQPPFMDKYSETDVLADLDLLSEANKNNKELGYLDCVGEKFEVLIMEEDDELKRESLLKVAETLQLASPELVKVFILDEKKIVLAFPSLKLLNDDDNKIYSYIIEELLRVTTFLLSLPDLTEERVIENLKNYIKLFIRWNR